MRTIVTNVQLLGRCLHSHPLSCRWSDVPRRLRRGVHPPPARQQQLKICQRGVYPPPQQQQLGFRPSYIALRLKTGSGVSTNLAAAAGIPGTIHYTFFENLLRGVHQPRSSSWDSARGGYTHRGSSWVFEPSSLGRPSKKEL